MSRLGRAWRALVTGGCVALVLAGALPLDWLYCRPLGWLVGDEGRRRRLARRAIGLGFRLVLRLGQVAGVGRVVVEGRERLAAFSGIIVANHPSLLDTMALMAAQPTVGCVVKEALWRHPCLGGVLRAAGYLPNDADPEKLLAACLGQVRAGGALLIFPEGTRSPEGRLRPFHRGAATVAILGELAILPVVITCRPPAFGKGHRWYHIPAESFTLTLWVGEPWSAVELAPNAPSRAIAARRVTRRLRTYFEEQLNDAGA